MKQTYLNSFCARCLTLLVLALLSTNLAWGETSASVELCTSWSKALGYDSKYTQDYTINDLNSGTTTMTLGVQGVYRQGKDNTYFQMNKKEGYFKNTTKLPGKITKIETTWSAAKGPTKCYFATNAEASSSDATVTVTAATSVTYTPDNEADYYYFNIDVKTGSGSAQMTSCKVYYEKSDKPAAELVSLAVSGNPTKKSYFAGETFDPTGLTVTGTYDDHSEETITSGITWSYETTNVLTKNQTSIKVKAIVNEIKSNWYTVNGLTVTEKPVLPNYKLVTDASTLTAGDKLLLVGIKDNTYYGIKPYESGNNIKASEIPDPEEETIALERSSDVAIITLGGITDNWTLYDGAKYLYAAGGTNSNNYLKATDSADALNAQWTINIADDGKATIKTADSNVARHTIRFNTNGSNDPLFACYASGQDDVYIYKYEAKTKEVTISDAGWATVCLPFNATISDNATAYYVTTSGSILNKVEANVIPANEGVLLKSNEGGAAIVTFTEIVAAADEVKANYMKGSVAGETFDESGYKYYILANDGTKGLGFYFKVEGGASVECAAGKAVLAVPNSASPAKEGFSFDEPTGIESLTPALSEGKGVYNLNGMRVNGSYKGIMIMNGKKYINK